MSPKTTSPSSSSAIPTDSAPNIAETESKAWDKLADETQTWYDRFITYLGLGPTRTIEATYRERRKTEKGLNSDRPNSDWHRRARTYNWEERAAAYDKDRQQTWLELEESVRLEARQTRRDVVGELLQHVYTALRIANLPELDEALARRHLPTLRALLADLLKAHRLEMGEPTEIQAVGSTSIQFSADELAEAQRQLEHALQLQPPAAVAPPGPPSAEPQPTETRLLVVIGEQPTGDNSLNIDISILRGVQAKTGMQFHRIVNPSADELEAELIRARRHGVTRQYVHMAVHAGPQGIELRGGAVDGDWLSAHLSGTEILLLAGCKSTGIGDWLSVIPFVVTFDEEITHQNAAAFTAGFWTAIALGKTPEQAIEDGLSKCVPSTREYIHKHW